MADGRFAKEILVNPDLAGHDHIGEIARAAFLEDNIVCVENAFLNFIFRHRPISRVPVAPLIFAANVHRIKKSYLNCSMGFMSDLR